MKPAREDFFSGANTWRPWAGLLVEVEFEDTGGAPEATARRMLAAAETVAAPLRIAEHEGELLECTAMGARFFIPLDEGEPAPLVRAAMEAVAQQPEPAQVQQLRERALRASPGAGTLAVLRAATRRGIPWSRIEPGQGFFQLGQGIHGKRIRNAYTADAGLTASALTTQRRESHQLLRRHAVPVGELESCASLAAAQAFAQRVGYPVRLMKVSGSQLDVIAASEPELARAFRAVGGEQRGALAAPQAAGERHQLLVMGGRCVATLPPAPVHDSLARIAERAARVLGLDVASIELRTTDPQAPLSAGASVVEAVVPSPELAPFIEAAPHANIADAFISMMIAPGDEARVPTAGITGSVGKTTTCTLVAAILAESGMRVGRTTTQGAWIGKEIVALGDVAGGRSARQLLHDPSVEAGVFELARGGLLRSGFGLGSIDVGAVLNVFDQHVGFDGIESREDMARLKSLVVRQARKMAVLNADEPLCLAMRAVVKAPKVALVSLDAANPALESHRAAGGIAAWHEAGVLHLFEGGAEVGSLGVEELPTTWKGRFRPGLWHALFAMAIAHGLAVPFAQTAAALRRFQSTPETNPGRMNTYEGLPYQLLVAHASGPEGMGELMTFVAGMEVRGRRHLFFCLAGNRTDEYIRRVGREAAAGNFDRYICSDWAIPRGRPPREVALLLAEGLREGGIGEERIAVADSLPHGVEMAYGGVQPGDLLVENTFSDASKRGWLEARGLG